MNHHDWEELMHILDKREIVLRQAMESLTATHNEPSHSLTHEYCAVCRLQVQVGRQLHKTLSGNDPSEGQCFIL